MRNAQVAEWILSVVTSPERAAAAVGDLLENAVHEWHVLALACLRTAVSLTMAGLCGRSRELAGSCVPWILTGIGMILAMALVL